MKSIACKQCGGSMIKKRRRKHSWIATSLIQIFVFVAGVVVFILIPVIGWVLGPIIMLCSLFIGGKSMRVWQCRNCGYFFQRG